MLQIPNHSHLTGHTAYENFAAAYLPPGINTGAIALARQHETLIWLNADAVNGQFYFIVDVLSNTILHCYGIERWMGYTDKHFTTKKYREILCPAHALAQHYYGTAAWAMLLGNHFGQLQFMQPVCAALIGIKNAAGSYLYCRRLCSPFQLTAEGRVTEYVCRFTLLGAFDNGPCGTWLYNGDAQQNGTGKALYTAIQKQFEGDGYFSPQELRVIKKYAYVPGANSAGIAESLKIEKATVNIYNKRILAKAEKLFARPFANAKEVAEYLKRMLLV